MTLPFKLPLRVQAGCGLVRIMQADDTPIIDSHPALTHLETMTALVRIVNEAGAFQESVSLLLEHAVSTGEARTTLSLGARSEKPWYAMSDEQQALCERLSELLPVPVPPAEKHP